MKNWKKLLHILLALALVLTLLPAAAVTAHAATGGQCGDGVNWTLDGGTLTISGSGNMQNYDGDEAPGWFESRESIRKIVVKSGVKTVGAYAFFACYNATEVSLPASLRYINGYAFAGCAGLTGITIPTGVQDIGVMAFLNCTGLTTVSVAAANDNFSSDGKALFNKDKTVLYAFVAQAYKSYTVPSTVKTIAMYAFANCMDIQNVTIPEGVTSIGEYAFADCMSLTKLTVPASVESIGMLAFADCPAMESFQVAAGNQHFSSDGKALFNKNKTTLIALCAACTNYHIPTTVKEIGMYAFAYNPGTSIVVVPASVNTIGELAFASCSVGIVAFMGDQPDIADNAFAGTTCTFYVPNDNTTWGALYADDFGGDLSFSSWTVPHYLSQPHDVGLPLGEQAYFAVEAAGEELAYQWQFRKAGGTWNNVTLDGADDWMLTVPVTAARNGFQYRCVITDSLGIKVYSDSATLTVKTVITTQPKAVTAAVGDTARFTVAASGVEPAYQWQFNGGTGWKNATLTGYNTATLSVPVTAARNGYQYRCVITDANGAKTTSDAGRLTVKTVIKTQPQSVTAAVGDTARFTVSASGAGLTYQWQFNGGTGWKNSTLTGAKTAAMSVPVTAARNGYRYRCVITDANGGKVTSSAAALTVETVIKTQPKAVTAAVGETARFTVSAAGAGLTYQWQFNGGTGWKNSTLTGAKTATMSVPVTAARNGYQYRCVITDANGVKTTSDAAALTVKTVIKTQPQSVTAAAGDTVKFTVSATGAGLTYRWQFNNGSGWQNSTMTGYKTAAMSVPVTAGRNGYRYRCVITDANGGKTYTAAATLTVQ